MSVEHTSAASPKMIPEERGPEEPGPEEMDPNDSELLRDKVKGQTSEHATPPRLEDEGQSGG